MAKEAQELAAAREDAVAGDNEKFPEELQQMSQLFFPPTFQ